MRTKLQPMLSAFICLWNLLFVPKQEWERIVHQNRNPKSLFLKFVVPIVTFCSLLSFSGAMIHTQHIGTGLSHFFVSFLSLTIGIYSTAKLIELLMPGFYLQIKPNGIFQLVVYSSVVFCLFHALAKLFVPHSFINQICLLLELYFIRILWLGTAVLFPVSDNKRPGFTIMASLLILVIPLIFERMFSIVFGLSLTI